MATKYYVDAQGNFLGGFDSGTAARHPSVPGDAIEIDKPPAHALQKLKNGKWTAPQVDPDNRQGDLNILRNRVAQIIANRDIPQAVKDAFSAIVKILK